MQISRAFADSSRIGQPGGYIYLIFAPSVNIAYVGQTRSAFGPIGRLAQHISNTDSNTFIQRVTTILKLDKAELNNIYFFAAALPAEKKFSESPSEFREAVEGLVQSLLLNLIAKKNPKAILISRVRLNAYSSSDEIAEIAGLIAHAFSELLVQTRIKYDAGHAALSNAVT
jgi:hypothetical protein